MHLSYIHYYKTCDAIVPRLQRAYHRPQYGFSSCRDFLLYIYGQIDRQVVNLCADDKETRLLLVLLACQYGSLVFARVPSPSFKPRMAGKRKAKKAGLVDLRRPQPPPRRSSASVSNEEMWSSGSSSRRGNRSGSQRVSSKQSASSGVSGRPPCVYSRFPVSLARGTYCTSQTVPIWWYAISFGYDEGRLQFFL